MNNSGFYHVTGKDAVPQPQTLAGTISTDADYETVIRGTGTDFSLVQEGDWLFDEVSGEIRKIKSNYGIHGTQRIDLFEAFTTPLVAGNFKVLRGHKFRTVSVMNAGEANGLVNGNVLIPGEALDFTVGTSNMGVDAISVDGTGTTLHIQTVGV